MLTNRSAPPGIIMPVLIDPDVSAAAHRLCGVLGFTRRLTIGTHRIQLTLDEAPVVDAEPRTTAQLTGELNHSILVRIADVNSQYDCAVRNGATTSRRRRTMSSANAEFGRRSRWLSPDLAQTIADVDPATWGGRRDVVPLPFSD